VHPGEPVLVVSLFAFDVVGFDAIAVVIDDERAKWRIVESDCVQVKDLNFLLTKTSPVILRSFSQASSVSSEYFQR
jgi:hypothetical protein